MSAELSELSLRSSSANLGEPLLRLYLPDFLSVACALAPSLSLNQAKASEGRCFQFPRKAINALACAVCRESVFWKRRMKSSRRA
jgi:hypothetical protein